MSMDKVILLSNPERIPSHDEAGSTETYALGWTFTVALDPGFSTGFETPEGKNAKAFLQPFRWNEDNAAGFWGPVEKLFLFQWDATAQVWSRDVIVLEETVKLSTDGKTALGRFRKELSGELATLIATGDRGCLTYGRQGHREVIKVSRSCRPWPALIAEQASEAFPVPQALGLSRFARIDPSTLTGAGEKWLLFPVLRVRNSANDGWDEVLDVELDAGAEPPVLAYGPKNSGGVPEIQGLRVEARCPVVTRTVAGGDLGKLWVASLGAPGGDWRSGLEDRLAGALDPGPIFAGWISELRKRSATDGAARAAAYKLVVAAATEVASSTFLPPVQGTGREWQLLADPKDQAEIGLALRHAADFFASAKTHWAEWIEKARRGAGESSRAMVFLETLVSAGAELEGVPLEELIREIETLSQELAVPEVARRLFEIHLAAFSAQASEADRGAIFKLRLVLPVQLNFRRIQLKERLRLWWQALLGELGQTRDQDLARDQLKTALADESSTKLPLATWIRDAAAGKLGLLPAAAQAVADQALMTGAAAADRGAGPSRGISLQVHALEAKAEPGQDDLLSQIRGVGVLMRRRNGEWRCLNQAMVKVRVGQDSYEPLSDEPGVLPSRLAYLAGLSAPLLTYDNSPLTVPGPLALRETTGYRIEGEGGELPGLLRFGRNSRGTLPGLAFGQTYEFLAFLVSNSGILPKALARKNSPWQMRADLAQVKPSTQGVPPAKERTYAREAQIGSCRFGQTRPDGGEAQAVRDGMPAIPRNVSPKARELTLEALVPAKDPLRRGPTAAADVDAKIPLLLLAEAKVERRPGVFVPEQFSFHLHPPAIDLETWDRWRAADALAATDEAERKKIKDDRRSVRLATYVLSQDGTDADLENDRSLDDPAVVGLWYEVQEIWPNPSADAISTDCVDFRPIDGPNLDDLSEAGCRAALAQRRRPATRFRIGAGAVQPAVKGAPQIPPLAAGKVYRFSAYAILDPNKASGAGTRFSTDRDQEIRREGEFRLTSPWHLLIETVAKLGEKKYLPLDGLEPKFYPSVDVWSLRLNPPSPELFHRAELLQQVWSWRGREPAERGDRLGFEMSEFGDRSDDEHRLRPMQPLFENGARQGFEYQEAIPRSGADGDPRAHYYRLSARVFSRYEGILPEDACCLEYRNSADQNRWKALEIPCRFAGVVPPPNVKMVLPLTGGVEERAESPGLMVVVDGPWYQVGGLGERLEVEVMDVVSPECVSGEGCSQRYFQLGTDPILDNRDIGDVLGLTKQPAIRVEAGNAVEFAEIRGAIGLQRDRSATDPYFLASTFLLAQPRVTIGGEVKQKDLSWSFLKLRFRRSLTATGREPLVCEPTGPFWVQLLPAVARVEEDFFEKPPQRFSVNGGRIDPGRRLGGQERFGLVGVITQVIRDAAGRAGQEAFADLAWPDGSGFTVGATLVAGGDYRLRWLVVQRRSPLQADDRGRFWDLLFRPETADRDRARIVRMSQPHSLDVR